MYQDDKYRFNWIKVGLKIFIALLVIILLVRIVFILKDSRNDSKSTSTMQDSMLLIEKTAKKYFVGDNLPKVVGKHFKISLSELVKAEVIDVIKDENGRECNMDESYVKVTKLDSKYQFITYLKCKDKDDSINSYVNIDGEEVIPITTTVKTTKKKTTTTTIKTTTPEETTTVTTSKLYEISFNTNGGQIINSIKAKLNEKIELPIPVRVGYKFNGWYVHDEKIENIIVTENKVLVAKWIKE